MYKQIGNEKTKEFGLKIKPMLIENAAINHDVFFEGDNKLIIKKLLKNNPEINPRVTEVKMPYSIGNNTGKIKKHKDSIKYPFFFRTKEVNIKGNKAIILEQIGNA